MARDRLPRNVGLNSCLAWIACLSVLPAAGFAQSFSPGAPGSASAASVDSGGFADPVADPLGESLGVLPQIGSNVPASVSLQPNFTGNDLSDQLRQVLPGTSGLDTAGKAVQPAWSFAPSLGVTQEYDSGSTDQGGSSVLTTIEPSIAVHANTARVRADIDYSAIGRIYEQGNGRGGGGEDGNQSRFSQDFNADVLTTVLPQTLFVDLRGFGSEQPRFAGSGSAATTTLDRDQSTQNYSFSASPYLVHRFGDIGTAELGYSYERTLQGSDDLDAASVGSAALASALDDIANQNLTTQDLHAAFTTGEDFGRYEGAALANGTTYGGGGVYRGAYRHVISIDNGYAITHTITALARIGYEDIHYSGTSPISIHDIIWDAGLRLTPSASSSISARYGHHDGFNTLTFNASVAPTARTRVFAQYSAGLSTPLEDLQNGLAESDLDALGSPVDNTSGTPLYVTQDFNGAQDGLYRLRRLSVGGQLSYDRDVIALSVNRDQRSLVSGPNPLATTLGAVSSNTETSGSVSWSHELSPWLSAVAYFQYGVSTGQFAFLNDSDTLVASLSANYQISDTLTLTALYSYTRDSSVFRVGSSGTGENRVLVGLSKSF